MEWFTERQRTPYQSSPESTSFVDHDKPKGSGDDATSPGDNPESAPRKAPNRRRYGPRTCRICLDVVEPKFPTDASKSDESTKPIYVSDDPELGRMLCPCKCKGSQKYVHEGCLNSWRLANPMAKRNYWQCPTCKFSYRLVRLHWASMLSSWFAQAVLTLVILVLSIFILGFLADPILNLWFDPVGTISETVTNVVTDIEGLKSPDWEPPTTWSDHFIKGFFSLGLVGMFKSMLTLSPWHWWNLRSLTGSGRRGGTGRARVENISLGLVIIGAITALVGIWKAVKRLSARVLKNVSERVLDVGGDDGDDDFVDDPPSTKKDE